ncbi:MAG: helix-turn-helix domain-containing protein [Actinomycetota bacterium]|nr:helix-turn-helix domain-containing protein [Actinomycetota bacterium]
MGKIPERRDGCSIQGTLDVIGDRWTLLILRDLFRGVRRFSQLEDNLGIAKNLLASRLSKLVAADIVTKIPYQDKPIRHEYFLTQKGRDLSPSLVALMRWGDRWCNDRTPPTLLVHSECGTPLNQITQCPTCDESLDPDEIRSRPGPGASVGS